MTLGKAKARRLISEVLDKCAKNEFYGFALHAKFKAEDLRKQADEWEAAGKKAEATGRRLEAKSLKAKGKKA